MKFHRRTINCFSNFVTKVFTSRFHYKLKWLKKYVWHVSSFDLEEGRLGQVRVFFDKERDCNWSIFVTKSFQKLPKPETINEHEKLKYMKRQQKKLLLLFIILRILFGMSTTILISKRYTTLICMYCKEWLKLFSSAANKNCF